MSFRQGISKRFAQKAPVATWPSFDTLSGSYLLGIIVTSDATTTNLTTPPPAPWTLIKDFDTASLRIRIWAIEDADIQTVDTPFAPVFDVAPNGALAILELTDIWTDGGALEASAQSSGIGSDLHSGVVTTLTAHDVVLGVLAARNTDAQSPTGISQIVTGIAGDGNPNPPITANANKVSLGLYFVDANAIGTYDLTCVLGDGTPSRAWGGVGLALKDVSGGRASLGQAIADQRDDAVATQLVVNGPRSNALKHTTIAAAWPASMSGDTSQPPAVTLLPVDGISESGALLHALVDVKGQEGQAFFDVGHELDTDSNPVFDTLVGPIALPAQFGDQDVSVGLTALVPSTTYYVRARATSVSGASTPTPTSSFTTLAHDTGPPPSGPPTVDLGPYLRGQTQTTVTFGADVSAHGAAGTVFGEQQAPDGSWSIPVGQQPLAADDSAKSFIFVATGLLPGHLYNFRVRATNPNGSDGDQRTISDTTDAPPTLPVPTALPAGAITSASATLLGQVDHVTNESPVDVVIEYGTTTAYGTQLPVHHLSSGAADSSQAVSDSVIGLTPATTYHYRVRATRTDGIGGTIVSADQAFTTAAPPVIIAPEPGMLAASGVVSAAAVLNGVVGDVVAESPTLVSFEYGPTAAYGTTTPPQTLTYATPSANAVELTGTCDPQGLVTQLAVEYGTAPDFLSSVVQAGQLVGSGPQPYRIILAGLAKNTTYWYRVRATTASGTSYDQATPRSIATGP